MSSLDALRQLEDRHVARSGRFEILNLLLADYRRAVAAEEFYDQLRGASAATSPKVPRSEIARAVFDKLYAE